MNDLAKKATARDLLDAWRRADERARTLRSRLKTVTLRAHKYRHRLVELAKVTRRRKHQTAKLRERLLQALEKTAPAAEAPPSLPPELENFEGEQVPVEWLRHVMARLNQAQGMLEEYQTLLAFRENQVHELLERVPAEANPLAPEPQVMRLARDLAQSRNRIRLLTLELMRSGQGSPNPEAEAELEQARESLATAEARVEKLEEVMRTRIAELQKASANLTAAKARLSALEEELAQERAAREELTQLYGALDQRHQSLIKQHLELEASNQALEESHLDLQDRLESGANPERTAKLEAAVHELKAKLQLVSSKYTEVKEALQARQAQLAEAQKKTDFLVPLVQTLETALDESRRKHEEQNAELAKLRSSAEMPVPAGLDNDQLEEMETKLREARRTAVRAQTEAAAKRRESTRLEAEVETLRVELEQVKERSGKLEELARAQARKLKQLTGKP